MAFNAALIVAYNICQVAGGRHHVAAAAVAIFRVVAVVSKCTHGALEQ